MCVVTVIGRIIIVVLNVIFVIVSLVMLVSGIVLKFFAENDFVKQAETEMKDLITSGMSATSLGDTTKVESFKLSEALSGVAIALIVIGAILLTVSIFGMIGGWCKVKFMLLAYAGIVAVFLLTEIIVAILFLGTSVGRDLVKDKLKGTLKNYQGLEGTNLESFAWNGVMLQFKCCGIDGYGDFAMHATSWNNTKIVGVTIDMPFACCKTLTGTSMNTCALKTNNENYKDVGCVDKLWEDSVADPLRATVVLLIAFGCQLMLIIFAILLYKDLRKKDKVGPGY